MSVDNDQEQTQGSESLTGFKSRILRKKEYRKHFNRVVRWVLEDVLIYNIDITFISRSRWPRGLRRRSAAAWLLGSRVRIPRRAYMFCLLCLCVVFSCVSRGLCDGLITHTEESYRVINCV
jgi:hypothetical protein